jgi:hypothetical protein
VLYNPALHEPLTDTPWSERLVCESIARIVQDADTACDPEALWPANEWDSWQSPTPLKTLYVGAAGVVLALDMLRRRGHAETGLDLARVALRALEGWRDDPGVLLEIPFPEPRNPSLFMGESGIALVLWRLEPDAALADDLLRLVRENLANPVNEVMWGVPGTLLAARALHEWTGEERWEEAARESEAVARSAGPAGNLTPFHGLVGNALVLGEDVSETLRARVVVRGGLANWPPSEGVEPKLQWCDGAPGIVTCAASSLDDELLLAAVELAWQAGPLGDEKGSGLCHGTAGTGYAFLKAFERTQDGRWLDRARRFAIHALEQTFALPPRYSLWTGGAGVALFAADCVDGTARYPVFETW